MYRRIEGGEIINIQGLDCCIPPVGYVWDIIEEKLIYTGVYSRSENIVGQYWERFPYPSWYKEVTKREDEYLKNKKDGDPQFYDEKYEEYKRQEWFRRLNGMWVMIKGRPVFIPPLYYYMLQWFRIDVGYIKFTKPHLNAFMFLEYCIEDPVCWGMLGVTKRRFLKTYMIGAFITEYITRTKNTNGGLQSKTGEDAKKVFAKAIVFPFRSMPRFFRPEYDTSLGINPKTEMRFQQTNIRGKKAEDNIDKDELNSMIGWGSAAPIYFDGWKLQRYGSDEWGKCFAKGTKIRMYDGSIKNVEDISEGELVMGDDSTPRITFGITRGIENMYSVVPKKGKSWGCNESHILSLKWCLNRDNKKHGWKAKSIVNITIRNFLLLKPYEQRHLMLYKKEIEYTEQVHELDPYFLGLWLGDGSKHNPEITTADPEIVDYLKELANIEGLEFSNPEHIQYRLSCKRANEVTGTIDGEAYNFSSCREAANHFGYKANFTKTNVYKNGDWIIDDKKKNRLLTAMQEYNLIENKHIPIEFLIDSKKNRLQLLAGIVDSDGHISKGPSGKAKSVEITQKLKHLAYQINELAISLGFYSSIQPKIATMKRNDKSVYRCEVYKVMIYGDLWQIPTKVVRKKVSKIDFHVNRRTAAHCGFSIKSIGVGEYYGFAVDGNNLFLLEDGTVVHNTTEANVYDRNETVRFCQMDEEGKIIGKSLWFTTVEKLDSDKDGVQEAAKQLWNASDQNNRKENGQTESGLYRFFQTADESKNFDIYGDPDVEKTITEILSDRESVKNNIRSLSARIRKEPRTIEEAFSEDGEKCVFNVVNIMGRENFLIENPIPKRNILFYRDGETQKVEWRDIRKGEDFYWRMSPDCDLNTPDQNKFIIDGGIKKPIRTKFGAITVDSYSNSQGGRKYGSKASAWLGIKKDGVKKAVGHLYGRPPVKEQLHEQVMMCAEFMSYLVWYEHTSDDYLSFFRDRGKVGYLGIYPMSMIDHEKRNKENLERHKGTPITPFSLTKQLDNAIFYFEEHIDWIDFEEVFPFAKKFDPYNRTESDAMVSLLMLITILSEEINEQPPPKDPLVRTYGDVRTGRQTNPAMADY